jgi:hypothetical protein
MSNIRHELIICMRVGPVPATNVQQTKIPPRISDQFILLARGGSAWCMARCSALFFAHPRIRVFIKHMLCHSQDITQQQSRNAVRAAPGGSRPIHQLDQVRGYRVFLGGVVAMVGEGA